MTIAEFIEKLSKLKSCSWYLTEKKEIRCGEACPITAVCYNELGYNSQVWHCSNYADAAKQLGLESSSRVSIVCAADKLTPSFGAKKSTKEEYQRLRNQLLEAVGLKENSE